MTHGFKLKHHWEEAGQNKEGHDFPPLQGALHLLISVKEDK